MMVPNFHSKASKFFMMTTETLLQNKKLIGFKSLFTLSDSVSVSVATQR